MDLPAHALGQALFIRTGCLDYGEVAVPFQTLEEMVRICSEPRAGLSLERVVVFLIKDAEPIALTLGFIAASKGLRPSLLPAEFKARGG